MKEIQLSYQSQSALFRNAIIFDCSSPNSRLLPVVIKQTINFELQNNSLKKIIRCNLKLNLETRSIKTQKNSKKKKDHLSQTFQKL